MSGLLHGVCHNINLHCTKYVSLIIAMHFKTVCTVPSQREGHEFLTGTHAHSVTMLQCL